MTASWIYLVAFLIAWLVTDLMIPWVTRWAIAKGRVDTPDARKVHTVPIPRLGGIAIMAGTFVALGVIELLMPGYLFRAGTPWLGVLAGGLAVFVVGVIDDLHPLPAKLKFALQIGAGILAYGLGVRIEFLTNPMTQGLIMLPLWLSILVTVFWLVGITNTINLIDGLDGLAAGVSVIAACTLTVLALQTGQIFSALIALTLAGSTLGFLRYNFNPARIFMGDSGSLFLGFVLAAISVTGVLKAAATVALFLPILILGVPIFDTAFAIVRRSLKGQPIFQPDRGHLHHRLLGAGLSQRKAVLLIYGISSLLGGIALHLGGAQWALAIILGASVLLAWTLRHLLKPSDQA